MATQAPEAARQAREDAVTHADALQAKCSTLESSLAIAQAQVTTLTAELSTATRELEQHRATSTALSASLAAYSAVDVDRE